jgi:prepilin-type N-terminal cleavage/methylation domain-containing protein/prepilin-type processing-associated H-X9-DG protein
MKPMTADHIAAPHLADGGIPARSLETTNSCAARCSRGFTRGFTLVEVLIVVTVVALLLTLLLPALHHAKTRAKAIACASRLRQSSIAIQSYVADHEQHYPNGLGLTVPWQGNGNPYPSNPETNIPVVTFALVDMGYLTARTHYTQYDGEYYGITMLECPDPWISTGGTSEPAYGYPPYAPNDPSHRKGCMLYSYFAFGWRNRNPGGNPNAGQPFAAVTYRGHHADELLMQDWFFPLPAQYYNHGGAGANALYADLHVEWWDQENLLDWDIAPGPYDPWRLAAKFWPPY